MLTYRLAGTTDETGSTATNPSTIGPATADRNHGDPESSRTTVRQGTKTPCLLTCDDGRGKARATRVRVDRGEQVRLTLRRC